MRSISSLNPAFLLTEFILVNRINWREREIAKIWRAERPPSLDIPARNLRPGPKMGSRYPNEIVRFNSCHPWKASPHETSDVESLAKSEYGVSAAPCWGMGDHCLCDLHAERYDRLPPPSRKLSHLHNARRWAHVQKHFRTRGLIRSPKVVSYSWSFCPCTIRSSS